MKTTIRLGILHLAAVLAGIATASAADVKAPEAPVYHLRVAAPDQTVLVRPELAEKNVSPGEKSTESRARIASPDGKSVVVVQPDGKSLAIEDAKGKQIAMVSAGKNVGWPVWSPDSSRIVFVAHIGDYWQLHAMDRDGGNVKQMMEEPFGVTHPQFLPDGRISFLLPRDRPGKLLKSDLVVLGPRDEKKVIVPNTQFADFRWSPDGKVLAYSVPGELVFLEAATGKAKSVVLGDIDPSMKGHGAHTLTWRPDGGAVACAAFFWGGRMVGGPKMLGDEEIFIITREGKAKWFEVGKYVQGMEWVEAKKGEGKK